MFHSAHKKIRGQRRRLKTLLRDIDALVPYQDDMHREYEHFHVPCGAWIQSPRTAGHIKTIFCNAWIEKSKQFIESKPKNIPFCKVVAVISYPRFAESQIIIFITKRIITDFGTEMIPRKNGYRLTLRNPLSSQEELSQTFLKKDIQKYSVMRTDVFQSRSFGFMEN